MALTNQPVEDVQPAAENAELSENNPLTLPAPDIADRKTAGQVQAGRSEIDIMGSLAETDRNPENQSTNLVQNTGMFIMREGRVFLAPKSGPEVELIPGTPQMITINGEEMKAEVSRRNFPLGSNRVNTSTLYLNDQRICALSGRNDRQQVILPGQSAKETAQPIQNNGTFIMREGRVFLAPASGQEVELSPGMPKMITIGGQEIKAEVSRQSVTLGGKQVTTSTLYLNDQRIGALSGKNGRQGVPIPGQAAAAPETAELKEAAQPVKDNGTFIMREGRVFLALAAGPEVELFPGTVQMIIIGDKEIKAEVSRRNFPLGSNRVNTSTLYLNDQRVGVLSGKNDRQKVTVP